MRMRFEEFARAHGVLVESARASGAIERCPTKEHPKKRNGAYWYDGRRGWVCAWDGGAELHWYGDDKDWTPADRQHWQDRRDDEIRRRREGQSQAAIRAQDMLARATLGPHGYLSYKGFPDAKGFVLDDELLVPMRDCRSYELTSVQRIWWDAAARRYEKRMLHGGRAKGAVFRIGARAAETALCEGYATGLSIRAALGALRLPVAVLVCFSDRNLVHVSSLVGGRRWVFADNDASGAGERAAQDSGVPYCMADEVGMDANDLHAKRGLMAVMAKVMEARMR